MAAIPAVVVLVTRNSLYSAGGNYRRVEYLPFLATRNTLYTAGFVTSSVSITGSWLQGIPCTLQAVKTRASSLSRSWLQGIPCTLQVCNPLWARLRVLGYKESLVLCRRSSCKNALSNVLGYKESLVHCRSRYEHPTQINLPINLRDPDMKIFTKKSPTSSEKNEFSDHFFAF